MPGVIKDDSIFLLACDLSQLQCVLWNMRRKSNSRRRVVGKGRRIWYNFSDTCGFSSLILHQNSASGNSLKASCNAATGIISWTFRSRSPWNPLVYLALGCFPHRWFCNFMHWSFGKCWLQFSKCWHICLHKILKIAFINITTNLFQKSLSTRKLSNSSLWMQVFQNSIFLWNLSFYQWQQTS